VLWPGTAASLGVQSCGTGKKSGPRVSGEKRAEDGLPSRRSMRSVTVKETALGLRSGSLASTGETTRSSCASMMWVSRSIDEIFCAKDASNSERLARAENGELGNGEAEGSAEEDVGGKVGLIGDAGKADERSRTVGYIGNPAMAAIAMREDSGNGKRGGGVAGRKTSIDPGVRHVTAEEGVVERAGGRDVRRTETMRRNFQDNIKDGTIGVGLTSEEGGLFRVGIVSEVPDCEEGRGNDGDFACSDGAGEDVVESVECRGAAEVADVMGISDDKGRGHAGYGERWEPLMALGEPRGKKPDVSLILEKIMRKGAVGDIALRSRWR